METDKTTEGDVDTTNNETVEETQAETISIPKSDYDKLNQTLGSLKRELKDYKKPKDTAKETSKEETSTKPDDNRLLEKAYLRSAGITSTDEVELALSTAKKWGVSVDSLVDDEDFKVKLEKVRTQKSNELATSGVKGGSKTSSAKNTLEYWISKGVPPSREEVPDSKIRRKILQAFMESTKSKKTFYND